MYMSNQEKAVSVARFFFVYLSIFVRSVHLSTLFVTSFLFFGLSEEKLITNLVQPGVTFLCFKRPIKVFLRFFKYFVRHSVQFGVCSKRNSNLMFSPEPSVYYQSI